VSIEEAPGGAAGTLTSRVRSVLTHPAARRLRQRLRDMIWIFQGWQLVNPAISGPVSSCLFVCLGNICRSPFAAGFATAIADKARLRDVVFTSAGIRANPVNSPPKEACRAAARRGVLLDSHTPTLLTPDLMRSADLVVVTEAAHFEALRKMYPDRRSRIFLLPLLEAGTPRSYARYNIMDPYGKTEVEFDLCYGRIAAAVAPLVNELALSWARPLADHESVERY